MSFSTIEWTDATYNPWIGCTKVSPACDHCYAELESKRRGWAHWGKNTDRHVTKTFRDPIRWNRQAAATGTPLRVFCASLCDLMEDNPQLPSERAKLWQLIAQTPNLTWQLLTKRPQNYRRFLPPTWVRNGCPPNVWLMTTVESNDYRWRIDDLLRVSAVVHGISYEPVCGPLDLSAYLGRLDWVIVGGESGPGARNTHVQHMRDVVKQCQSAGIATFVKQMGKKPIDTNGQLVQITSAKGGNIEDIPADLRIRQFPTAKIRKAVVA